MKVNGKDYPIYEMENLKKMFQTTNQVRIAVDAPLAQTGNRIRSPDIFPTVHASQHGAR